LNKPGGKVTSDFKAEIRGVFLVFLFVLVAPLAFFPQDFGLKLNFSFLLLWAFELGWYMLIFFISFSKASAPRVILAAILTWICRISLGIGFGLLLLALFSLPLSSSLKLGSYKYTPAFLLQALMSPFALKSLFGGFMKKTPRLDQEHTSLQKKIPEAVFSPLTSEKAKDRTEGRGWLSSEKDTKFTKEDNLENILSYLREYAGVKGAILVDFEGLVVAKKSSPDFDFETVATFARCLKEANDRILQKMGGKSSERIGIYTPDLWLSLIQIESFLLIVVSDRHTDELLSVRMQQSVGMIKRFLTGRYQQNIIKAAEG
jgi:predicted regulator of Ras-like GTPase activity (Roadblock/LC7/MglB family)